VSDKHKFQQDSAGFVPTITSPNINSARCRANCCFDTTRHHYASLRATERHLPYVSTQCYVLLDTGEHATFQFQSGRLILECLPLRG